MYSSVQEAFTSGVQFYKELTLMTKSFNETFLTGPSFFLEASKFLFKSSRNLLSTRVSRLR
ncbi:hypothetical protein KC19_2G093600 [Ceratodon purpureus]|uniref:Uncharacterized protein n=1 Tax=Ceratodon purpureus TaxID=3225 RepID=A0A8T0HXW0_CERPU|nr:hypothetical protein KC19_N021900 [Ceratodon purpureus]KAG0568269.1 hypothetical protein KC19_6G007900 [Ceratodon purpureus]KAG0575944.1 hypothetical protein KC19_5G042400 [Ceratodon purpureus]KAG0586477.1 hypothetical protein KC19_2G093600 [Ceratodon purpureus]